MGRDKQRKMISTIWSHYFITRSSAIVTRWPLRMSTLPRDADRSVRCWQTKMSPDRFVSLEACNRDRVLISSRSARCAVDQLILFIRIERFVQKYQQFIRSRIYALTSSQQECAARWSSKLNFSQSGNWTTLWQKSVSTVDGWNWREFAMNVRFARLDRKHHSRRAFADDLLSKEWHRWERFSTLNLFTTSESLSDEDVSACRDDRCVDLEKHSHELMQKSSGSPTSLHFRSRGRRISFDWVWSPAMHSSDYKRSFERTCEHIVAITDGNK